MISNERDGQAIGFVGLGNMGLPMARRLVAAGYQVRGFDPAAQAMTDFSALAGEGTGAAVPAAGPAEAAAGACAVILMLPDSNVVEHVVLDQLTAVAPGTTIIDMSSSDPARTRVLAGRLAESGVTLIDAPVSGGVAGAEAGTLTIMVGGPAEACERFKPLLSAMGSRVTHAGGTGCGHAVKALNNLMSAANLLVASEALVAGQRFGLDPAVMLDIINGSSGRSGATENKWPNFVLTEKYLEPGFAVRLMVKDIRLALGIEHATGVPSAASAAVVQAWEAAMPELPPDADHTAIAWWVASQGEP